MWMLWLLWGTLTLGGFFMGGGALVALRREGFDLALALNALLYTGCGLYSLPKLVKLFGAPRPGGH
jgi:hypothetical protein